MSETTDWSSGHQTKTRERNLFSLKHKLISRTARHMENLYLKFQKRANVISRSHHIPRVSYKIISKTTLVHRSKSHSKEAILEEADQDLSSSVVQKYQNWVKEQGGSISKEVIQKMGKTDGNDLFQSTHATEMGGGMTHTRGFTQNQGFFKQTNLDKLKQLSSQLEQIPQIERKTNQPRSRSEIKGRLVKVMKLMDQIQKEEKQQRAYYQEKHLCPMSKGVSRHQREKLELKARNGLSAQHYHPLYTQVQPNQPHATFLSRRNFRSSLWISFNADEEMAKSNPSQERQRQIETSARKKRKVLSTKVSSTKISSSLSPSRSPERNQSLSPQRSIKDGFGDDKGSPGKEQLKMKKASSFKREEESLPSQWGPIIRKQDHLPNILFSRYVTRKPNVNVEGNPHPGRFENRNLFPQVMASNRRFSAQLDFSKMPVRKSVLDPPNQSYLPDYEPNYIYFKYPNTRKGIPRRGSESAVILVRSEDNKRRAITRHLI